MKIFYHRLRAGEIDGVPSAVAMGYFDGLHMGHRAVIEAAKQEAVAAGLRLAVFTFARGPKAGRLILTESQKREGLAALGVQVCYQPDFDSFHDLSPEAFFTEMLVGEYGARALSCGEDFGFGAQRAGNVDTLRRLCREQDVQLNIAPTALYKGEAVSSSRIRAALAAGAMEDVNAMLGRPYEIDYPVKHGRQLGGKLGMPTINQSYPEAVQPPAFGVYITETLVDGAAWTSATGYGTRPTVDDGAPTCETFIPGFRGDLYGDNVRVRFYKKISDPVRFASLNALADGVRGWAAQAQAYFETGK